MIRRLQLLLVFIFLVSLKLSAATTNQSKASISSSLKSSPRSALPVAKKSQSLNARIEERLEQARLQFKSNNFAEAIRLYQTLPKGSPAFLQSREELGWAYLKAGDWSSLSGLLAHLNSPLVPLEHRLEGRVLASINDLHTCRFSEVKNEMAKFQTELRPYVKNLDRKSDGPSAKNRTDSVNLNNKKSLAKEAILKMRFVKAELLNQLYRLEKYKTKSDSVKAGWQGGFKDKGFDTADLDKFEKSKLVFSAQGDFWPDEFFNLKGLSPSECTEFKSSLNPKVKL